MLKGEVYLVLLVLVVVRSEETFFPPRFAAAENGRKLVRRSSDADSFVSKRIWILSIVCLLLVVAAT